MFEPGISTEDQGCALGKVDPDVFFEEETHSRAAHICIAHCPRWILSACYKHAQDTSLRHGFAVDTVQAGLLWPAVGGDDQSPRDIEPAPASQCQTCSPPEEVVEDPYDHPGSWPYRKCRVCDARVRTNPDTLLVGLHVDNLKVCPGSNRQPIRLSGLGKKHCKNGHEYTPENTVTHKNGRRECRQCKARARAASLARKAAGLTSGKRSGQRKSECKRGHPRKPDDPASCRECRSLVRRANRRGISVEEFVRDLREQGSIVQDHSDAQS